MVDVIIDGEPAYCLPDCTCCTACHKLITEVDECPFPEPYGPWSDPHNCTPDCNYYHEIWGTVVGVGPRAVRFGERAFIHFCD